MAEKKTLVTRNARTGSYVVHARKDAKTGAFATKEQARGKIIRPSKGSKSK